MTNQLKILVFLAALVFAACSEDSLMKPMVNENQSQELVARSAASGQDGETVQALKGPPCTLQAGKELVATGNNPAQWASRMTQALNCGLYGFEIGMTKPDTPCDTECGKSLGTPGIHPQDVFQTFWINTQPGENCYNGSRTGMRYYVDYRFATDSECAPDDGWDIVYELYLISSGFQLEP